VEEILKNKPTTRGWYQMDINMTEDGMIGPFNFTTQQDGYHNGNAQNKSRHLESIGNGSARGGNNSRHLGFANKTTL
jgi:hypothetical protein